ncbi:MAG: 3-deoxy-manno-octulosonate cytidylyltransferase [Deltaproteobacteria bacterium]|nr:MAG: 3-deoxy-manno-octulosonate cytidylyltransferase [Deltaproteobacteria bacterium]
MKIAAIIPARYGSTRLPGKPLIEIKGKPLIQYVYERAKASSAQQVIVATDDKRILIKVKELGGEAVLTSSNHRSGTDRVAEVAANLESDIVVNVQGDEPLIRPEDIDRAISPLAQDSSIMMTTLAYPLLDGADLYNPHVVKVVIDLNGFALYFSRSPIPYSAEVRGKISDDPLTKNKILKGYWQHTGLYAYRRDFLLKITALPPTPLERQEGLEQLRVLENGYKIKVVTATAPSISIDTPEDLQRFKSMI